ncbi:DUF339-domain-containing protein [Atractiella rhizophila]|nr:DUF339-domain-containing protein [Atractiella rhizophila]
MFRLAPLFRSTRPQRLFSATALRQRDPYPVPSDLQPPPIPDLPRVNPERPTEGESAERMRARLLYNTRKRGILETDLLLSTFATRERLATWDEKRLEEFDRFLTLPDWSIYYLSIGKQDPPKDSELERSWIVEELREHAKNKDRVTRKMPDL